MVDSFTHMILIKSESWHMQVYSKSLLWSVKVNILFWFKCCHKSAQTFLLLLKIFSWYTVMSFDIIFFVKEIVSCIKETSKHQNNIRTILNVFMYVKMHIEKIIDLVFMLITNLAQVTLIFFINLILTCQKFFIYVGKFNLLSLILIYSFMYI